MINTKKCLICKGGQKNDCLHWHISPEDGAIWVYCVGKCQRGYSIYQYCHEAGIPLNEFLKGEFDFVEARPNEVTKMEWPSNFVTLSDPRAKLGVEYIKSRGLKIEGDMYYDVERKGIVFPYYYENVFVGAQIRFIEPWIDKHGAERKIDTMPGTRLGLVFYGWNSGKFVRNVKGIIATEGAFNCIAIQQALNDIYGGLNRNPWLVVACSGSGVTSHHKEVFKELKDQGLKIVAAPDFDEAGLNMLEKLKEADVITHYALTMDEEKDWNDVLKEKGHSEFANWFMKRVKSV